MYDHERTGYLASEPVVGGSASANEDLPRERPVHASRLDDADPRQLFPIFVESSEQTHALHPRSDC
jgi:hypothetical protein